MDTPALTHWSSRLARIRRISTSPIILTRRALGRPAIGHTGTFDAQSSGMSQLAVEQTRNHGRLGARTTAPWLRPSDPPGRRPSRPSRRRFLRFRYAPWLQKWSARATNHVFPVFFVLVRAQYRPLVTISDDINRLAYLSAAEMLFVTGLFCPDRHRKHLLSVPLDITTFCDETIKSANPVCFNRFHGAALELPTNAYTASGEPLPNCEIEQHQDKISLTTRPCTSVRR